MNSINYGYTYNKELTVYMEFQLKKFVNEPPVSAHTF